MIFDRDDVMCFGVKADTMEEAMEKLEKRISGEKPDYKVFVKDREVKVERYDGKVGIAKCHPDDEFDISIGFREAVNKINKPLPKEHEKLKFKHFLECGDEDIGIIIRNKSQLDTIAKACNAHGFRMRSGDSVLTTCLAPLERLNGIVLYSTHTYGIIGISGNKQYEFEDVIIEPLGKFKVGDIVIGNDLADDRYGITTKGYVGIVTELEPEHHSIHIKSAEDSSGNYCVEQEAFDLYEPKPGDVVKVVDKTALELVGATVTLYDLMSKAKKIVIERVVNDDICSVNVDGDSGWYVNRNTVYLDKKGLITPEEREMLEYGRDSLECPYLWRTSTNRWMFCDADPRTAIVNHYYAVPVSLDCEKLSRGEYVVKIDDLLGV